MSPIALDEHEPRIHWGEGAFSIEVDELLRDRFVCGDRPIAVFEEDTDPLAFAFGMPGTGVEDEAIADLEMIGEKGRLLEFGMHAQEWDIEEVVTQVLGTHGRLDAVAIRVDEAVHLRITISIGHRGEDAMTIGSRRPTVLLLEAIRCDVDLVADVELRAGVLGDLVVGDEFDVVPGDGEELMLVVGCKQIDVFVVDPGGEEGGDIGVDGELPGASLDDASPTHTV